MKSSRRTIGRDRDCCSYSLQIMILAFLSGASATATLTTRRSALGFSLESVNQGTIPPARHQWDVQTRACNWSGVTADLRGQRNTESKRRHSQHKTRALIRTDLSVWA